VAECVTDAGLSHDVVEDASSGLPNTPTIDPCNDLCCQLGNANLLGWRFYSLLNDLLHFCKLFVESSRSFLSLACFQGCSSLAKIAQLVKGVSLNFLPFVGVALRELKCT
jgi:hypothetical protein